MTTQLLELLGARMLGKMLLWGTLTGGLFLALAIGGCVILARTAALRVGFPGARFARGVIYAWLCLVSSFGAGALGALHGAVLAFGDIAAEPAFTASTLRPAAGPLTEGLIHAVAVQAALDPAPMLAGTQPIPVAPLRLVLTDTTGAALFAGLRRVPALQGSAAGRSGSAIVAALGGLVASGKVHGAFEAIGMRAAMVDLAAVVAATGSPTITREALTTAVERRFLPRFVQSSIAIGERQLRWSGIFWLVAALVAPIALLWLVEGIARTARSRRTAPSTT